MVNERMVNMACNAMLVAGMEMGREGDHWPVIKTCIDKLKKDWEDLKAQRSVHSELKVHLGDIVRDYEVLLAKCPKHVQAKVAPLVREMRDVYQSAFDDIKGEEPGPQDVEGFAYWKTSEKIIRSLTEGKDE